MAVGDLYQLSIFWTYEAQECVNVFHNELISGTDSDHATKCWLAWEEYVMTMLLACTADTCTLNRVEVVNLMDPLEFHVESGIDADGTVISGASQSGASFLAYGFRLEKAHPGASNGYKRFPGVAEGYTAGNVYDPPGNATGILSGILANVIAHTAGTDFFRLSVVKRPWTILVPPTVWWLVTDVTYTNLTSQNSRKT